jgi:outer membrane protein insertion porin family
MGGIGSIRGFDSYGITIRDPATGEVIGGDKMVQTSLDLFFPIPYMKTEGFRGLIFLDAGTLWGSIDASVNGKTISVSENFSAAKIRVSTGVGIEWISPVGPIGLVWGFPIRNQPEDVLKSFEFAIGARF